MRSGSVRFPPCISDFLFSPPIKVSARSPQAVAASSLHVAAMLLMMGVVSVVVYDRIGLRILRRGWFNLDLGWRLVTISSGAVTLFTSV